MKRIIVWAQILPTAREAAAGRISRPANLSKGVLIMLKAAGITGSIFVIIALIIALLKAVIAFVGFVGLAIKIIIVLAFLALFAAVAFMVFRGWQNSRRTT